MGNVTNVFRTGFSLFLVGLLGAVLISCQKDDEGTTPASQGNGGGNGSGAFQLNVTVDGVAHGYTDGVSNYHIVPGAQGDCDMPITTCTSYQECVATHEVMVEDRWKIGLVKTFTGLQGSSPSRDLINTMAAVGTRPFGKFLVVNSQLEKADGARIEWTDPTGMKWSTDRGSEDQAGSSFEITESVATGAENGARYRFRCTFNCKLYNDAGQSKTVTGGGLFGPLLVD